MKEAVGPYLTDLKKEASFYKGTEVSTIYIGGGTPSCLNKAELEFLFEIIHANFKTDQLFEWTLEANPATFDLSKAVFLRRHGISRVSLGIQSFSDEFLKYLGRPYTGYEAVKAYEVLRRAGFVNLSVDLMYGFASQREEDLAADVRKALALNSEHISLYGLTVSGETVFYKKGIKPLDSDEQADYYRRIHGWLAEAGQIQYEVSNFAKKGYESRHNFNYWQGGEYIGLGVSAHSHFDGTRFWNVPDLVSYGALIQKGVLPRSSCETLPADRKFLELLLVGLRMSQGVDIAYLEARFGVKLSRQRRAMINRFVKNGFLQWSDSCLKASMSGTLVLDEICAQII